MDETIAPSVAAGLSLVGTATLNGLASGADTIAGAVMGVESKDETKAALSTLARALFFEGNRTGVGLDQDYSDTYNYESYAPPEHSPNYLYSYPDFPHVPIPEDQGSYHRVQQPYYNPNDKVYFYDNPNDGTYFVEPRVDPDISLTSYTNPTNDPYFYQGKDQALFYSPMTVEEALYILGKNFLGRNVTDRILPIAKQLSVGLSQVGEGLNTIGEAIPSVPSVQFDGSSLTLHTPAAPKPVEDAAKSDIRGERNVDNNGRITTARGPKCTTPSGGSGRCVDLNECPILVADLTLLRKSICFKGNFLPGICCPDKG